MRILFIVLAGVLVAHNAAPQAPTKPLSFEVASVKSASQPIDTKDEYTAGYNAGMRAALSSMGLRITGQRVNITDNSLRDLIRLAYQVKDYQITAPAWMTTEKYEIVANMPAGADRSQAPEMLRTLLETRFHLKLRRETKSLPVYALVVAKGGLKMTPVTGPANTHSAVAGFGLGRVLNHRATLADLADQLSRGSERPIIDATGVTDRFDFDFSFSPDTSPRPDDTRPSLAEALQPLGLKLEKRDMPMEVLVIESADKAPSEN